MNEKIIVSYVKSPSKWGESLFQQIKVILRDFSLQHNRSNNIPYEIQIIDIVEEAFNGNRVANLADCQRVSLDACLYSDIYIFDGSIEEGQFSQYQFAYDLMKHLDHVLIVSRTELPYNLEGRRKGGAPSWIVIGEEVGNINTKNDPRKLNANILNWVKGTLEQLELPRRNKMAGSLTLQNIMKISMNAVKKSDDRMEPFEKSALFISYLSRDYDILKNYFPQIEERTGLSKERFHYFAPGRVAKEFMTEKRRWELVSIADREMSKAGALLIFETEGYYRSWWTMGERMSVSYRFQKNWENCPNVYVVKVYYNDKGTLDFVWEELKTPEQKRNFFPALSEQQIRRLARRFANSDPDEAAYELDEKMVRQSNMPKFVKVFRAVAKGVMLSLLERDQWFRESFEETDEKGTLLENISQAMESENSYTHTKEFQTKRIVECSYCRETSVDLTIDNFIQLDMPYVYRIEDNELLECQDGTFVLQQKCPLHGSMHFIKNGFYYRFIQPRRGMVMGEKQTLVESIDRIDVYENEGHDTYKNFENSK
ncbi:MAG: hypothetical protein K2M46_06400 [Lachnospiraceae bacterium]|nr:hypothetical protein [Lachnospiraceae bacterium]